MTKEQRELRMQALTRLAIATREKVDRETYVLYLEDTSHVPLGVLVTACRRLEKASSWFPKVHDVLEECRIVAARQREEQEGKARLRLMPPAPAEQWRAEDIKRRVQELVRQKGMRG